MRQSQNQKIRKIAFVDYKPAELRKNKDWIIVYYFKKPTNPQNAQLERKRIRVPKISGTREREKHAKRMCLKINEKLENG